MIRRARTLNLLLRGTGADAAGVVRWRRGNEDAGSVLYAVVPGPQSGHVLRLQYTWTPPALVGGDPRDITLDIPLARRPLPRGGWKWVGSCPLAVDGRTCGRPAEKLYLPTGSQYFGCRRCHRLTYRANRDHDKRVTRLLRDPEAVFRLANAPGPKSIATLGLVLNALTVMKTRLARRGVAD